jgi:hypothetical protein
MRGTLGVGGQILDLESHEAAGRQGDVDCTGLYIDTYTNLE